MLCWKLQAWAAEESESWGILRTAKILFQTGSEFLEALFDKNSHKSLVYTLTVQPKLLDFVAPPLLQQLARTVVSRSW